MYEELSPCQCFSPPCWHLHEQVGTLSLKQVGCSDKEDETVSYAEARNPPQFYWWASYASNATAYLIFAVAFSVLLYGLVRAIGWIIGGFAAR